MIVKPKTIAKEAAIGEPGCEWTARRALQRLVENQKVPTSTRLRIYWCHLKRVLERYDTASNNFEKLWRRVQSEWSNIPRALIEKQVESMPKRIYSVVKAKGLWTNHY